MRRLLLLPLLAAVLLSGCKGNCRQLSEKLCDCAANQNEKNACLQRVANRASNISPTSEDNQLCGQLLPGCDCHTVNTVSGKYNCGLARQP
jgi:hypothetical protein